MDRPSATDDPAWRITRVAETGSTNDDLVAAARSGAPNRTVLVADHQTAGRGRLGRRWEAPAGASLLVSVLVRPTPGATARLYGATQAVALAAREACIEVAGITPSLKWPNDLLVGDHKLAGILAEGVVDGPHLVAVVIGMGLNVAWPPEPTDVAISASDAAGRPVERDELLDAFLRNLATRLGQWEHDPERLAAAYRAALGTLGRVVRVETPSGTLEGTAVDVKATGELIVERAGQRHEIGAGDVIHLRTG